MAQIQPAPARSNPIKWILIGCFGMFLLGGAGIGGCIMLLFKATQPPVDASERFLKAMAGKNATAAKAEVLPEYAGQIEPLLKAEAATWGGSWNFTGRSINKSNGLTTAVVTAVLTGTDGKTRLLEIGLKESGGWRVMTLKIDGKETMPSATLLLPEQTPGVH